MNPLRSLIVSAMSEGLLLLMFRGIICRNIMSLKSYDTIGCDGASLLQVSHKNLTRIYTIFLRTYEVTTRKLGNSVDIQIVGN